MSLPQSMRPLRIAALSAVILAAAVTSINAQVTEPITSPLNCEIGDGGCAPISTFGQLRFSTTGQMGDVRIDFLDSTVQTDPLKILTLFLNVNESTITTGTEFSLHSFLGGPVLDTFALTAFNTVQADGCPACLFDLEFNIASANISEPTALFLNYSAGSIQAARDIFVANAAGLDAAVHFGNCGVLPCNGTLANNNGSIFVGETFPTNVPEPASIVLLGAGLAGLGFWVRRRGARD